MIAFEQKDNRLAASIYGEFTLEDFKGLEAQVGYQLEFKGRVNLLLDVRDMVRYTIDVAWEEIKFHKSHPEAFEKIAVVTDDRFIGTFAWLSNLFSSAEIMNFDDLGEAEKWLSAQ